MLSEIQNNVITTIQEQSIIKNIYDISDTAAESMIKEYNLMKDRAILGDQSARSFVISQYARMLRYLGLNNFADMHSYVNFSEVENNEPDVIFELLLAVYDINYLANKYGTPEIVTKEMLLDVISREKDAIGQHFSHFANQLILLATLIYVREYGQDCIDTLQYQDINEIGILNKDYIYIVYRGQKIYLKFLSLPSTNTILNIQKKTTTESAYNYDEHNPSVITAKLNSSRISVAGYDMTPTSENLYYNERIFNLQKITLEEMRDTYSTINQEIYDFLVYNQKGRGSYLITGSDMGVGKSTFLLAMIEKIPQLWGVGVLDTQNELQAHKKYPDKNILTLVESEKRSISQCFEYMLKTSRDILIVGEITKPAEVSELINASLRLNAGVGATFHSLSPEEVILNCRNLLMRTEMYANAEIAEVDLAKGLDLIINLMKLPSGRIVVSSIDEIMYVENNIWLEPVLEDSRDKKIDKILDMLQLILAKSLYQNKYRLNRLVQYNKDTDEWQILNTPSEQYLSKLSQYTSKDDKIKLLRGFISKEEGVFGK